MFDFVRTLFRSRQNAPHPMVTGYALRFKDGDLLPFATGTPQGVINVLLRLTGMTHEQAEDFFVDLEVVEVKLFIAP